MQRLTSDDWLRECPHHVTVVDNGDLGDAIEWCLETFEPRDWHVKENVGGIGMHLSTRKRIKKDTFAFRNKKDAVLFKLMFWNT